MAIIFISLTARGYFIAAHNFDRFIIMMIIIYIIFTISLVELTVDNKSVLTQNFENDIVCLPSVEMKTGLWREGERQECERWKLGCYI